VKHTHNRDGVYTTLKQVDDNMLVEIQASIKSNEKLLDMEKDISSVHALMDDLAVAQADALNYAEEHKYRDAVAKKLDSLVAIEEAAVAAMRARMMTKVKADVVTAFTKDKKVQENALAQAIAVLTAGKNAKLGKDVVGEVYTSSLKAYKDNYAKQPKGSDEIIAQLEKDIAAACEPPKVDFVAGNVYETHPLIGGQKVAAKH